MKKIISLILVVLMIFCFAGCGKKEDAQKSGSVSDIKVGAIYINSKNDTAGYTFAHHNGITTAMKDLGMDVDTQLFIVDEVPEDKQKVLEAIDTLIGNDVDIIFGISFGYIDAMEEAAKENPDVIFSHATGYKSNETNFNNYFGRAYQARYLAGIAAGLKSLETGNNNVGYVAAFGTEYAETASGINGFALGVQAVNPNAKLYVKKLGNWADPKNESAFATELIESYNCGIISQHCDSAQPQIAAEKKGVFGCGYNSDMTADAPKAHLTAAIWNWNVYYETAIKAAADCGSADKFVETMGASAYYGGLKENFVDVSPLSANCTAGTAEIIAEVKALIVSGEWDVFSGVKLQIAADGTITKVDADLVDNAGKVIVAAGGPSVEDGVMTGSMDYYVAGVNEG